MALNRKFNFGPEEDELDVLRGKHAQLWKDFGNLKVQYGELEKQHTDLKREKAKIHDHRNLLLEKVRTLEERAKAAPPPRAVPTKSSIFLIIAAMLVAGRLVLYVVVEGWGAKAGDFGTVLSVGFAAGAFLMLVIWVIHECQSVGWLVAPNLIFLVVATCISAATFDPVLLETGNAGKTQHPVIAATALILCLLFAATRLSFLAIGWLLLLVTDPRRYFKK